MSGLYSDLTFDGLRGATVKERQDILYPYPDHTQELVSEAIKKTKLRQQIYTNAIKKLKL